MSLRVYGLVERNNEPDIMPGPTERLRQGTGHITQAAGVGERCSLRSSEKDFHQLTMTAR